MTKKVIWKQPLQVLREQTVELAAPATVLHLGTDYMETPCLWYIAEVNDTGQPIATVRRTIILRGTGCAVPEDTRLQKHKYLGTVIQHSVALVWHFWEVLL